MIADIIVETLKVIGGPTAAEHTKFLIHCLRRARRRG